MQTTNKYLKNEVQSLSNEFAMSESLASGCTTRLFRELKESNRTEPSDFIIDESLSKRSFLRFLQSKFEEYVLVFSESSKKEVFFVTAEIDPFEPKQIVIVCTTFNIKKRQFAYQHVIARLTHHFIMRYIQRSAKRRNQTALSQKDWIVLFSEVFKEALYYTSGLINGVTNKHAITTADEFIAMESAEGLAPVILTASSRTIFTPHPTVTFLTFIDTQSLSEEHKVDYKVALERRKIANNVAEERYEQKILGVKKEKLKTATNAVSSALNNCPSLYTQTTQKLNNTQTFCF